LVAQGTDPEDQIRAALRPLIECAASVGPRDSARAFRSGAAGTEARASATNPRTCPNCGAPASSERTPYCTPKCKETAAFVRQFRSALADGSIFDPERLANFGEKWWSLQGGGFPRRQLMVPAKTIAKVIERAGGKCEICGAPATEIDHTGSG